MGSLVSNIGINVVAGVISTALISFIVYLLRRRIISLLKRGFHFIFDTTGRVEITRIDKFSEEPTRQVDHSLFKQIQQEHGEIRLDDLSPNHLRVVEESLSTAIEIQLERNVESEQEDNGGNDETAFKLIISTDPAMRFGYRSYDEIDEFRVLSGKISKAVSNYCFDNSEPSQSLIIGELDGRVPAKQDSIDDQSIGFQAEYKESKLIFNISEPENLTRGIRRYFAPIGKHN